jgi:TonB-dependent SusC/RagA subfamily outer membrane receptor
MSTHLPLLVVVVVGLCACAPAATRSQPDSVPMVTAADFEANPGMSIENILQKKVPGLEVVSTNGGIALRIRGVSSWDGRETPPLYILNGLPLAVGGEGVLPGFNLYEIHSIRVLRGAEAAMYGIRGANGVIVITTKKPGDSAGG